MSPRDRTQVEKLVWQAPLPKEPSHWSPGILYSFYFTIFYLLLETNIPHNSWLYDDWSTFLLSSERTYLLLSPSTSRWVTKILHIHIPCIICCCLHQHPDKSPKYLYVPLFHYFLILTILLVFSPQIKSFFSFSIALSLLIPET